MKKEHLVYARWASVEQAVLLDNQVVEAEMRDIMALHNPGSGAYENAKKHRRSLRPLQARAIFRLAIKRIAQEAVEEIRPHLVTAMRVNLEVGALRRMGSSAHRDLVKALNYSSIVRWGAQRIAMRCRTKLPPSAVRDLRELAEGRKEILKCIRVAQFFQGRRKK